jgi:molybdopterin/thiamine biosynthesis adenylyltransferase
MTTNRLLRYSRHLLLDDSASRASAAAASHALIVGAGGLGSPVALYLGTAGVGRITIVDHDSVDLTNLQRQIAHDLSRLGQPKAESAAPDARVRINPDVQLTPRCGAPTRRCSTRWCRRPTSCSTAPTASHPPRRQRGLRRAPQAAGRRRGDRLRRPGLGLRQPAARRAVLCLRLPARRAFEDVACATMGVFAPLVGIIGSVQAAEALKLLSGAGTPLAGRLLMLDARTHAAGTRSRSAPRRLPRCAGKLDRDEADKAPTARPQLPSAEEEAARRREAVALMPARKAPTGWPSPTPASCCATSCARCACSSSC